jgi:hypothetical protein
VRNGRVVQEIVDEERFRTLLNTEENNLKAERAEAIIGWASQWCSRETKAFVWGY